MACGRTEAPRSRTGAARWRRRDARRERASSSNVGKFASWESLLESLLLLEHGKVCWESLLFMGFLGDDLG